MTVLGVRCLFYLWLLCSFSRVSWGQFAQSAPDKLALAQALEQESNQKKDSIILASAYYQYGKAYNSMGNHLKAQQYYMKALRILAKRGDSYELGQVYMRLSNLECVQLHCDKCIEHGRTALGIFKRIRSEKGMMIAYGCMNDGYGRMWTNYHNSDPNHPFIDTLWYYSLASEKLAHKLKDSLGITDISLIIGNLYTLKKNKKALVYIKRALGYYVQKKRYFEQTSSWVTLANCYLSFGELKNAREALHSAEQSSQKISREPSSDKVLLETYIKYYQVIHNYQKALEYSEKLRALEKKTLLSDREGAISRLNIEYETQKKDNKIKNQHNEIRLRAENERNQLIFLTISIGLLVLAVASSIAFYRLYRRNQRISRQNEELVKEQNHRVKNNLQVISSLLNLQARRLTDESVQKAMRESQLRIESMAILHRKLYEGEQLARVDLAEFIPELVENVERTFGQVSVERRLDIAVIYLEADRATLIGLILTELLTNAWKYAFPKVAVPTLRINVTHTENTIQIEVADNGPGWDKSQHNPKSLGMNIIKAQAHQLRAEYEFEHENGIVFRLRFKN
jgi:two-component sensor histidine kinase